MSRSLAKRRGGSGGAGWRALLVAGAMVAGLLIYRQLPEIRRYLRMRRM